MRLLTASMLWLMLAYAVPAQTISRKPPVPSGAPTRGFAIAFLSGGIDYTRPTVAARLARDGEGEVVGWDVIDNDRRPYGAGGPATNLVEISPALVAPFRLDTSSPRSWIEVLRALARTPARVAVVAVSSDHIARLDGVIAALAAAGDILFVVPASDTAAAPDGARWPGNVLVVDALPARRSSADIIIAPVAATREAPGGGRLPSTAYEAAMLAAALPTCVDVRAARSPADVKRLLLMRAEVGPSGTPPMLSACR